MSVTGCAALAPPRLTEPAPVGLRYPAAVGWAIAPCSRKVRAGSIDAALDPRRQQLRYTSRRGGRFGEGEGCALARRNDARHRRILDPGPRRRRERRPSRADPLPVVRLRG